MSQLASRFEEHQGLIWLELSAGSHTRVFAMTVGGERAVVVGSSPRAHFRVDRAGVPPVQFHFERDADAVHVALACPGELLVNGALVRSRTLLPREAAIEFCGVELRARLFAEPPAGGVSFEDPATTEHVRAYQLDQALDAQTVRASVPGLNALLDGLDEHTAELPTTAFEPVTTAFEPVTTALQRDSADLPQDTEQTDSLTSEWLRQSTARIELAALEHTMVMERPSPEPAAVVPDLPPAAQHTAPISKAAATGPEPHTNPAPPKLEAAMFETRTFGTMLPNTRARSQQQEGPEPAATEVASPARVLSVHAPLAVTYPSTPSEPAPKTPKADVGPAPVKDLRPEVRFELAPPARRVHAETKSPTPTGPSRSLNDATTAFEALAPVAPVSAPPNGKDATLSAASPAPRRGRPKEEPTLLARLGMRAKARPLPVFASAIALALLVGIGFAAAAKLLAPGNTRSSAPARQAPSPRASDTAAQPPAGHSVSAPSPAPPSPLAVAASPSAPSTPPRAKARKGEPADPDLSQAVGHVSAGRYAEAATAYDHLSTRPGGEVFRTLGDLLGRASDAGCKPSASRQANCPEVLR